MAVLVTLAGKVSDIGIDFSTQRLGRHLPGNLIDQ
jgi:hypothetical protein